jgi:hypothetical protein
MVRETKIDRLLLGKLVRIMAGRYRNQTGIALGEYPRREGGLRYMVGNVSVENPRRVAVVEPKFLELIQ